jgi:hypothetical protein
MNDTTIRYKAQQILAALLLPSLVLSACSSGGAGGGDAPAPSEEPGAGPVAAESDGFNAEVTSPVSVTLTWSPIADAVRYEIEASVADLDYFPLVTLESEEGSFEAFPVPDGTRLNFRLTAVADDGVRNSRTVTVLTPVEVPNPYAVGVTLEQSGGAFAGIDPSTFDPSTFDDSVLDPSVFDSDDFDFSSLLVGPASVTQEIGLQGGRIEATSSSGTVYTLVFPEGALPFDIDVSMTPVASLEGLPPEVELLGAVQIEPEGVPLSVPAVLTITEDRVVVGIGFGTDGDDFHFLPFGADEPVASTAGGAAKLASRVVQQGPVGVGSITMSQIQSQGATKASPSTVIRTTQNRAPADPSRATRQKAAAAAVAARRTQDDDLLTPLVESSFESWLAQKITDRAREAAADSGKSQDLNDILFDFEFLLSRYGRTVPSYMIAPAWDAVLSAIHAQLERAAEAECSSIEGQRGIQLLRRCSVDGSTNATNSFFNVELARRFSGAYGAEGAGLIDKIRELAKKCPRRFHVRGTEGDTTFDQDVCDYSQEFSLTGRTPKGNLTYTMKPSSNHFGSTGRFDWSGKLSGGGQTWTSSGRGFYGVLVLEQSGLPGSLSFHGRGCGIDGVEETCRPVRAALTLSPIEGECGP